MGVDDSKLLETVGLTPRVTAIRSFPPPSPLHLLAIATRCTFVVSQALDAGYLGGVVRDAKPCTEKAMLAGRDQLRLLRPEGCGRWGEKFAKDGWPRRAALPNRLHEQGACIDANDVVRSCQQTLEYLQRAIRSIRPQHDAHRYP